MSSLRYSRVLLKLSGEALMGEADFGIEPTVLDRVGVQHHGGDDVERNVLGDVDAVGGEDGGAHLPAPASSSGASGTVSIHSPSFSLSWRRSAIFGSEYSYSGLQNRASNGQTSTQMPQYMHRA